MGTCVNRDSNPHFSGSRIEQQYRQLDSAATLSGTNFSVGLYVFKTVVLLFLLWQIIRINTYYLHSATYHIIFAILVLGSVLSLHQRVGWGLPLSIVAIFLALPPESFLHRLEILDLYCLFVLTVFTSSIGWILDRFTFVSKRQITNG